ncbi:L-aspartate oxidase [Streptomyces sp. B6B3]|uniref:L-aspartate oxidase n=1 Tax=Streptomyces sp. B6B3 TaxID=3153570 RepID=UPI00325F7B51
MSAKGSIHAPYTTGPAALPAPPPGWALDADVVIVGSGIAGLTAALACAAAGRHTVIVTKARLDDGSTRWAQGGIAAALADGDTPEQHRDDTLVAGAGLCDEAAVRALVTEGPAAVRRLIALGARFDTEDGGELSLTREGGHHRRRIAHAGGDATGAEISRALVDAVRAAGIETVENALALDLLTDPRGRAAGVTLHVMGEGRHDGVGAVHAPVVVLATGGMGQVFSATTNPPVSTGDGVALALRAGAEVSDLEFVQFHPTVLYLGPDAEGQQPLISEAVRGEGAHLVDAAGVRFMLGQHELAELAPRDIVAKAIMRRMREQDTDHMYLDARHFGAAMWERRFPTILAACRAQGIDPVTRPIPVAPAAHYASGGVRTDLHGRTTVPGLFACGETACTGVHGANRLASNSLLEGLVFATRIATHAFPAADPHPGADPSPVTGADSPAGPSAPAPTAPPTEVRPAPGPPTAPWPGGSATFRDASPTVGAPRSENPVSPLTSPGSDASAAARAGAPVVSAAAPRTGAGASPAAEPASAPGLAAAGETVPAGAPAGATAPPPGGGTAGRPPAPGGEPSPAPNAPVPLTDGAASGAAASGAAASVLLPAEARAAIQRVMTRGAGVLRSEESLAAAARELDALAGAGEAGGDGGEAKPAEPGLDTWETANLHLVARVLVAAARRRAETRGCHWRDDRPERDDDAWRRHLVVRLRPSAGDAPGARGTLDIRTTDTTAFPPTVPPGPAGPADTSPAVRPDGSADGPSPRAARPRGEPS